jgi:hypothetical protein
VPWVPLDYRVFTQQEPFSVDGPRSYSEVQFPAVSGGQLWRVEQIQVQAVSPSAAFWPGVTATVYDRAGDVLYLGAVAPYGDTGYQQVLPVANVVPVDQTLAGNGDIAEYSPPITILEGNQLTVFFASPFSAIPAGMMASVRAQVAIMGGVSGQATPVAGSNPAPQISTAL